MEQYLYLSLMPEALVASMLGPEDFASYYAVGSAGTAQGEAAFFELDPGFRDPAFPIERALARCRPHPDGSPKHTVYVSIYRVLERLPIRALGRLFLVTRDGRSLALSRAPLPAGPGARQEGGRRFHLYHELAPTRPEVASSLGPREFFELVTGIGGDFPALPALAFVELRLGELAVDPEKGSAAKLPYEGLGHLRAVLASLAGKELAVKIFDRRGPAAFSFRSIEGGLYVGAAGEELRYYPMPPEAELRSAHRAFWKSANL
ncbi:MAG TPA: hypothetical protein PLB91_03975 [Spirochaetales bacterium]|nr:hypothetical protein [Spirochaetales bacterium]HRY53459.1 hypothetical protein [Spirochaetia bacterium]HRZ66477.1 hypothetical protein [Spirochaetia bacterium]